MLSYEDRFVHEPFEGYKQLARVNACCSPKHLQFCIVCGSEMLSALFAALSTDTTAHLVSKARQTCYVPLLLQHPKSLPIENASTRIFSYVQLKLVYCPKTPVTYLSCSMVTSHLELCSVRQTYCDCPIF